MPKEIIHFIIADRTAEQIAKKAAAPVANPAAGTQAATRAATVLAACANSLRLGSVLHDVFYYLTGGPFHATCADKIRSLPDRFHASGSVELLTRQAELVARAPGNIAAQGVLAGLISHVYADRAIHPFVVRFTGNYNDPDPQARTRSVRLHRALETAMDLAVCGSLEAARTFNLARIRAGFEGDLSRSLPAKWMSDTAGVPEKSLHAALDNSLDNFVLLRRIALSRCAGHAADLLRPLLPSQAREITALFYSPYLELASEKLRGPLPEKESSTPGPTLEQLMDTAAEQAADLFLQVHEAILADRTPDFGPPVSLENGNLCGHLPEEPLPTAPPLVEF